MPDFAFPKLRARRMLLAGLFATIASAGLGQPERLSYVASASAEAASGLAAISREEFAEAKAGVATALEAGHHVLFVELYGTSLYVFDHSHGVGGPVVRVLELLGFESILPDGVTIDASGARSLRMETLRNAQVEHVLLLNFSTDEEQVREVEAALDEISGGRLYRIDTTTAEALSDEWTEKRVLPRVASAIAQGAG